MKRKLITGCGFRYANLEDEYKGIQYKSTVIFYLVAIERNWDEEKFNKSLKILNEDK